MSREMENPDQCHIPGSTARDIAFHCVSEIQMNSFMNPCFSEDAYEGQMYWADDELSLYERVVLKRNRNYDPKLDKKLKIGETRRLYNLTNERNVKEDPRGHNRGTLTEESSVYFEWEKTRNSAKRE